MLGVEGQDGVKARGVGSIAAEFCLCCLVVPLLCVICIAVVRDTWGGGVMTMSIAR